MPNYKDIKVGRAASSARVKVHLASSKRFPDVNHPAEKAGRDAWVFLFELKGRLSADSFVQSGKTLALATVERRSGLFLRRQVIELQGFSPLFAVDAGFG
jgi:hypothetical protein